MENRQMNLPEGFVLDEKKPTGIAELPEGFVLDSDEEVGFSELPEEFIPEKELNKDVNALQQMKASGQQLTRDQERALWNADEAKPLSQKASEAITAFVPAAWDTAKQLGTGAGEFIYKGILKPIDAMSQSPEEAEKTLKEAGNVIRSGVHGVAQDVQETADAAVRFAMFGSSITDKLLGKSDDERFERYMLREGMRQFSQKVYEDNPDAAARLLAENPLLQKLAYAAALAQGGTAEEAEAAKKSYEELVKESGLTKEEINENVALLGEVISPLSLPGTNTATKFLNKGTSKVVQKTGELALKGIVAPLAKGTEKTAGAIVSGIEGVEKLSRKIGEYTIGDPDTLIKTATTTALSPAKIPARMTRGIARTVSDVAGQAKGVGGAAGRRGLFERAGRDAAAGDLTKKLFGPESLGGKGRARAADWAVRQSNAIVQPAVNGAVLNIAMGLPDIETATDLGYMAGVGAGIGAYGGARLQDRAFALVDPTTSLAQKIDTVLTPDPEGLRRDQDADIERFVATADASLLENISNLSNLDNIKSALDLKIKNLESKKAAQIRDEDANRIQAEIDNYKDQRKSLDKSTPETQAEIKRQIQLSFADAMDLAKTTGAAAGLNNVQVKILNPDQVEGFYRDLYGKTLTDAESVVKQLVGNPNLTEQESAMLKMADETIKQYFADVAGSTTARGFAISESSARPEHLRYANQKGATVVINGDLLAQMSRDGLNLGRVINHEMQHALSNFDEVRQMLAPLRKQLFDQKIQNPDGTFEVVSNGAISDQQLDEYAMQYAAGMDASGGASFLGQFANMDQVRAYMKEEVLSELAGLSGASHGDLRSSLDSAGRQVVDWLEVKSQNGALKKIKEGLRRFGVLVDDQGQFSTVLGAQLTPESLAAMRQYQRKLRDLNESMVFNSDPRKDAPEIAMTQIATNRALQERYKHSDFFEKEQVVVLTAPDGSTQEVVVPKGAKIDQYVRDYRFQNGQLVDEDGNVISLGPDVPLQAMPDGTTVSVDTRIARQADGSPIILSPRETLRRAKKRGQAIRQVIDDAPDDGSGLRLEDTGNGNYRGTLSPTQIAAINALPNDLVAPSLKRKIAFFNDILGRKDGSIVEIEYQAALRDGKYRALQPQLRTEIPIGFQFDKQGNFLMTTMSMSRMHDKANAWAAKRPRNLRLWGGDMTKFWDSVRQYLTNHKAGLQGHIGLHSDPYIAMRMKNRINDLFNVYRKETREANPERTTLPKRRGQDSKDVVIRSRRMDRINSYDETALPKMPFQYEMAVQNYLPAENPFAEYQSAEQFAQGMEVEPELVQRAIRGDIEPLELQLHEQDLLRPAEYVDVQDGKLRVRSMFDPTQPVFEPEESDSEVPAMLSVQFMPAEAQNIEFANPPSEQEAINALSSNKRNFFGLHRNLKDGYPVGLRIDIPAFTSKGVYVVTVHEKKKGKEKGQVGDRIGYDTIAKVNDPVFFSNEIGAKKIKSGEANKFPVATVEGKFNSSRDIPEDINEWTPVGYNPKDHSYFYDKRNEEPVLSGDEAISVGNTVFVKNPVYGNRSDFAFMPAEQEPQGMEGVEAPQTYRRISDMIPPLQGVEPPVRASGKQDKPLIGININDKTQDFTDQILRGEKTIETRDTNSLKSYIGKRVGIVKTGKGKATLVGYANIGEPIVYNNENEFRLDEDKHLVEQGSPFDIKPNSSKYGYPLTNVESIEPIQIPSDLPNWRVARSLPQTQFMPIEQLGGGELPEAIVKGTGELGLLRQALQGVEAPIREPAKVPEIPKQQVEVKQEIPVAKTEADAEEEVADTELRSTGIDVPESVDEQSVISNAIKIANSQPWKKGRDFKMDLQRRVLEAAEKAGVVISERTAEAIEYLARVGFKDALIALEQNPNAIGWYDEKTKQALGVMSLLFPEIATDENARFAFTWALAVTSNGLKVDKNFELAERVYRQYRKTGKMPTDIEAGQAQKAINEGLDLFNKLTKEWGMDNTRKFMQTDFTVGEIARLSKDLSPGGEFSDTNVRGSAILGPKIGNGFFSNLYGLFDALTMDRWLVRTWGRWTGTLVELNPELTKQATDRLQEAVRKLTPEDKARMDEMIKQDISQMSLEDLSVAIQKASMKPKLRDLMNKTETGEEFRKSGNSLAKYLDGQKEAPSGPTERNFIREIFGLMLDELKSDPKYAGLTMADLQAVLWYAEKRLYETAKVKADEDSLDSSDADGYEDDEAPDYANAAIGVAREKGVSQKRIDEVLERIKNERTAITRPEAEEGSADQARQQEGAGGFTGKEKQKFQQYVAVTTTRRNRVGNEKALWTYARKGGSDSGNAGVLKPKSKKNLGVKYISEWKPGRKLATMFRNNGLPPVKFLELDSTDKASAQKFADTLQKSKDASVNGAAVYVYPVEDYQGMKLFLSESGKSGFALKPDGDIVSVFSMDKGSGRSIMETAIAAGGKKLDAFDTILPKFYGTHGFVEAARIPWNDEFAPEGWDKQTFMEFNNGEPDVVMMVLDPKFEGEYEPRTDIYATDYDQAVEMQDSLLKKLNKGSKKK